MPSYCYLHCEWWRRYFWVLMSVMWFDRPWSSQLMELHNINDWDFSLKRAALVVGFAFLFFLHLPFYSIIIHQMNWNPELQVIICRHFAVCQMFLADEASAERPALYFLLPCWYSCTIQFSIVMPKYAPPEKDVYFDKSLKALSTTSRIQSHIGTALYLCLY